MPALTGDVAIAPGVIQPVDGFLVLERKMASFPWQSQALWFYSQMLRAGHVMDGRENRQTVLETYRPDLYRRALKPVFAPMPAMNLKREGDGVSARDGARHTLISEGFFDGHVFDPDAMNMQFLAE